MSYSRHPWRDPRRLSPRVEIEALCSELVGNQERHALVVDLSEGGLRVERPFTGGRRDPVVQIELELPEADEIIWAKGEVCFDRIRPGRFGSLLRTTGLRLAAAASRDLRLLRDYVFTLRRRAEAVESCLPFAASYLHG
jgi:hypothetical protein